MVENETFTTKRVVFVLRTYTTWSKIQITFQVNQLSDSFYHLFLIIYLNRVYLLTQLVQAFSLDQLFSSGDKF